MIGALDYLTLDHATVHTDFSSVTLPHQITTVSAPLPEEFYSPIGYWSILDSNWSPDFPLSARIARWFYGEDTGRWSDGVIGILDPGIGRDWPGVPTGLWTLGECEQRRAAGAVLRPSH
jgi:hypothetical protein